MGYSDTATYFRTSSAEKLRGAVTQVVAGLGFAPAPDEPFTYRSSMTSWLPTEWKGLHCWTYEADSNWIRIYTTGRNLFPFHDGNFVPVIQKVAAVLGTVAFEIQIYDGDSISLLETEGHRSVLTGLPSYAIDEVFDRKGKFDVKAGEIFSFCGVPFPYQNASLGAEIIPELIGFKFEPGDLQRAIPGLEAQVFGSALPSSQEYFSECSEYGTGREPPGTFSFARQNPAP